MLETGYLFRTREHALSCLNCCLRMTYYCLLKQQKVKLEPWKGCCKLSALNLEFAAKICLVTSFRETSYIVILPKDQNPSRELWLSFWSEAHYNSLYGTGEFLMRTRKKKHWLF